MSPNPKLRAALQAALLVTMTVTAYGPALQAGFIWDDDYYVTENELLRTPDGLRRIWLSMDSPSQYFPAVYTSFRIEYSLWGLDPLGYHLVNVLLHAANALLLWYLLARLALPGAWFAAAIFALHPVHVESVAWITERKNVLSLFFSLGSLLAWLRFSEPAGRARPFLYILSLGLYVLALASKTTACTLPAAQLLLVWLRGHAIDARRVIQVAPFLALGLAMGLVAIFWERFLIGTVGDRFSLAPLESLLVASRALWFYLGKLIWPVRLAFSYPRFEVDVQDPLDYMWLVAGGALLLALLLARRRTGRGPLVAALFFIATLAPLLGFIPLFTFWYTYVADHYQYVASIGPIALLAGAAAGWTRGKGEVTVRAARVVALLLLLALGTGVWRQSRVYENEETLWRDTIVEHPASWMAHTNLGRYLNDQKRFEAGAAAYRDALAIRPEAYRAHIGLAFALMRLGNEAEAIGHYETAIDLEPELYAPRQTLAAIYLRRGNKAAALGQYQAMIELAPDNPMGHFLLGRFFDRLGRRGRAIIQYRRALAIDPEHPEARRALDLRVGPPLDAGSAEPAR